MVHIILMKMNIAHAMPIGISHGSIRPAEQARTGRSPREDVRRPNPPEGKSWPVSGGFNGNIYIYNIPSGKQTSLLKPWP